MTRRPLGDRAVVLGGSIAGTFAARVLSEVYRDVVVVDRDQVINVSDPRRGTPQGGHAHGLHARGCQILEELFPTLLDDMRLAELPVGDLGEQRWYFNARRFRPKRTGLSSVTARRPVLEEYFRAKVAALPNVTFLERTELLGLLSTPDSGRVTGVRLRPTAAAGDAEDAFELYADLLVDATGRGSRTPVWLEELGYERPAEQRMTIGLAYTTRLYRSRPEMLDGTQFINSIASRESPRGGFFGQVDRDTCILSLTGMHGDHAPTDPDGFLAFARSLPITDIYDRILDAEPLTEPVSIRFPASVRRYYERLSRLPERLLVLGDAVCSLNPNYSQGMTVAAMEVMALRAHLARGTPSSVPFMRDVGRIVDRPWFLSTTSDLKYAGAKGPRPLTARVGNAYVTRLHHAAARDPAVTDALMRVAGLVDGPAALTHPRVLLGALRRQGARDSTR
ncbi:FAD-dependent oxidoreductase [Streptomyces sp. ID05-47C]|uniref:FAD-dependent oxidoreductase n=1 Tax=Streptomyces sp. ID05-47C TaxID=3028665 RepID=UPI0029AD7652|nr:FAD-dependent monooxygenase [Streptomyces sp. ID05-47C]MDX3572024.1 FAD-dependent monooxygenase [Streptomyces sp. ID05-47C]